jgi:phytoene dehydrogenase-like protein
VLVDGNRVAGVRLESGEEIAAPRVIANVGPKILYGRMVAPSDVPADFRRRMKGYKVGSGTFRMNVALSALPRFSCLPEPGEHHQAGIVIAPTLAYMDRAFLDAKRYGWSRQPIVEMLIPSTVDESLAPPGQHVASLFCQQFAPELPANEDGSVRDWDAEEDAAADTVIDTVEAHAPGFRASILGRQVLSPQGLERTFGLAGGDIFHGAMTLDQLWSARPSLGHGGYRGPVGGLYMCGAGTHPGGGVTGAPGHNCAHVVIADGGSLRRFRRE